MKSQKGIAMLEVIMVLLNIGFILGFVLVVLAAYRMVTSGSDGESKADVFTDVSTSEVHQNNTYNVKDTFIPRGQKITQDMFSN